MKRILSSILAFALILCQSIIVSAKGIETKADEDAVARMRDRMDQIRQHRPTVALVLMGGGAKGAAHIGVIERIEQLGIPVDMVLGTSMGGLIGGLYSLGYTSSEMEELVSDIDWGWIFSDNLSREYISYTDFKYKEKYLLSIPFYYEKDYYKMKLADDYRHDDVKKHEPFHIGADNVRSVDFLKKNLLGSLPSGYLYGQNVSNLISSLTIGYQDSIDFQTLPVPYVCVAADLVSGKAKIWHSGKMNTAMRSTMSIPGVFSPVRVDGMVLVDGGIRDNYPTALAREMGADIIIGVDLSHEQRTYAQVNNLGDIIGQGIDMLGRDALDRNINIPDVKIRPNLAGYNMMSFSHHAIDTIINRGREAAMKQDSLLRDVAERTAGKYKPESKHKAYDFHKEYLTISDITINGVLPKEKELLMERLEVKPGDRISRDELDHIVAQIYGTQCYDYVTYELLGDKEPFRLVLNCQKGPVHQLGIGVRADTEEIVAVLLNVGLYTHRLYGHSFDFTGKISTNPYLKLKCSYDEPKIPTINASASVRWTDMGLLNFRENALSLNMLTSRQEVYLSNMKWKRFDINLGLRNDIFDIRNVKSAHELGSYDQSRLTNDYVSLFLDARTYTFDDAYFPTKGANAGIGYSWTFAGYPEWHKSFHALQADAKVVVPFGDVFAFIPSLDFRFLLGDDVPVAYFNAIGGSVAGRYVEQQLPFIGITHLVATKDILTLYRTDFRFKLSRNNYLTAIVNYARDCDSFRDYAVGLGYFGAGLEYSYDTIFGPFSANIHWSNYTRRVGFYISAGYNF